MKVWILGIVLALFGIVLVLGLWLLGYHLTGRRAFYAWQAERVALGDTFGWQALAPPPVPSEDNFAEHPLVRGSMRPQDQPNPRFKALAMPGNAMKVLGNWQEGRRDDLVRIAEAYKPETLQATLTRLAPIFQELEQASLRPSSRLPIDYEQGEIPALLGFRAALRSLRLQAIMELRAGRSDQALAHLRTSIRVAEHLQIEPSLISALLRIALLRVAMQVAWEGIEDRRWNEAQLKTLQSDLVKIDLLPMMRRAWQSERQNMIEVFSATAENRPIPRDWEDLNAKKVRLGALGRGWYYRNLLVMSQFHTELMDITDVTAHRVHPAREPVPEEWLHRMRFRLDLIMARIAIPALLGQSVRMSSLQAHMEMAAVACALERYRLENGQYPDQLEALRGRYLEALPHDLVTGGPLNYRRVGSSYLLYQMGWNGLDDGGTLAWENEGESRRVSPTKGDWVWPHATATP